MAKQTMSRGASDNVYLHKDFHGALSNGLDYLQKRFGEEAARRYLHQFTRSYYAPLIVGINQRGLIALKEHFEKLYKIEGGNARMRLSEDELVVELDACPAVTHMREHGYTVAELFFETTKTVNEALCEGTPFDAELVLYEPETGRSIQRFTRRLP